MLYSIHGKVIPSDSFLELSIEDIFSTAYVDASITKFKIFKLFLVVLFLEKFKKPSEKVRRNGFSCTKRSHFDIWGIGDLIFGVLLLFLLMQASLTLPSWCRSCRWPDQAPFWHGARAHAPGHHSWSVPAHGLDSATSSTSGSLQVISHRWWLVCTMVLTWPWWSLEGTPTSALGGHSLLCRRFHSNFSVERGFWIHSVLGLQARWREKKGMEWNFG